MKILKKFSSVVLLDLHWNKWNGAYIDVLRIECGDFDRAILSFWTNWTDHVVINVLFLEYNNRKR